MSGKTLEFRFNNSEGKELSGKLELPDGPVRAFAIFVHCFTGNKDFSANRRISRTLRDAGFGTLRFDFTGLGASDGDFSDTNFTSNLDDLRCAFNELKHLYEAPQILIGHSLGGAAVLSLAPELPEINAIITIGAPSSTEHLTHLFEEHLDNIESHGEHEVNIGGRPFVIKKQFLEDIKGHQVLENLKKIRKKAILIFHSPQDETVELEHARNIYENAHHPKSFISLDNADHLLTNKADTEYVAKVIASWCERYIQESLSMKIHDDEVA